MAYPLPKVLPGEPTQLLAEIPRSIHQEFHSLLRDESHAAGFELRIGSKGGRTADWLRHFKEYAGSQGKAFDAVLKASRAMDAKHGTSVTQWVWKNLVGKNATFIP